MKHDLLRRVRGLAWGAALLLVFPLVAPLARGEDPKPDAAERARRIEEARRQEDAETRAFEEKVNAAIARGAEWLRGQQKKDGSYPGFADRLDPTKYDPMDVGLNALVVSTLAHCGTQPDDDAIKKALLFCQFHYSGGKGSWNLKGNRKVTVYTAATLILALDAVHRRQGSDPPVKRDRYGTPQPPGKPGKCELPAAVRTWIVELVDFLVKCQTKEGGWRYPDNSVASVEAPTDLSNTQYALLGLDTASRCGFEAPPETWIRAAEHTLKEQEEEGIEVPVYVENDAWAPGDESVPRFLDVAKAQARGWTYLPGRNELPTGSMTAAGVACLSMAKERLWAMKRLTPDLQKRIDRGILDGLAWLSDHFTVEDNPDPPNQWHYYYLYGLERVGSKCGVRWIGKNDWYRTGALHLLAAQGAAGGWPEAALSGKPADNTESAITQTCFALLFLKRTTRKPLLPSAPPVVTGGGGAPSDGR